MARTPRFVTAESAARELGVTLATLYAYVSRGLIRSEPTGEKSRARRYHAEDVQRLKDRKEQRRDPERAARSALHLGAPVLESSITLIEGGRLYYRGFDAVALARSRTIEDVAALIWTGKPDGSVLPGPCRPPAPERDGYDPGHPGESFQRTLARAAGEEPNAYDLRPAPVVRSGVRILRILAGAVSGEAAPDGTLAEVLGRAWAPARAEAARLLDAAMILCADHELNVAAFTARCAASAGATPYGVVIAGLSSLGGARQSGGEVERVEALFDEAARTGPREALASRLRRGEGIPGFGHPLYPDGDPRGAALLELLREIAPDSPDVALAERVARSAAELLDEHPVVDFGLVAMARALGLPSRGAHAVFAIGRSVGFIGHALEQYAVGRVVRPRARYVGPPPSDSPGDGAS